MCEHDNAPYFKEIYVYYCTFIIVEVWHLFASINTSKVLKNNLYIFMIYCVYILLRFAILLVIMNASIWGNRMTMTVKKIDQKVWHFAKCMAILTLILLNLNIPWLCKQLDTDHLASEEANWSGSALFVIKYVIRITSLDQVISLAENYKYPWHLKLFSMTRVKNNLYMSHCIQRCLIYLTGDLQSLVG